MMAAHDDISARAVTEIMERVRRAKLREARQVPMHVASSSLPGSSEVDSSLDWYALVTNPKCEAKAALGCEQMGLAAYFPRTIREGKVRGKKEVRVTPLFPRYVFVGFKPEQGHGLLRGVDGVESMVRFDGQAIRISGALLHAFWSSEKAGAFDYRPKQVRFRKGDTVKIVHGAFSEFIGTVSRAKPGKRVEVMLNGLFGGQTTASIDATDLRAVAEEGGSR